MDQHVGLAEISQWMILTDSSVKKCATLVNLFDGQFKKSYNIIFY